MGDGTSVAAEAEGPRGVSSFMRKLTRAAPFVFVVFIGALAVPSAARAQQAQVQGFGGMTVGTAQFGSAVTPTFGGNVAFDLLPNLQGVGEFGRLDDISSPVFDLLEFTNVGVN